MQVNVQVDQGSAVISVSGDVDLYSSPEMRKALAQACKKQYSPIVVDLSNVDYMDSSGVATLVEGMQLAQKFAGAFCIACLKDSVREVFELARLDRVFKIYSSVAQALESCGAK